MMIGAALALGSAAPALAVPSDLKAKADAYLDAAYPADGPGASVIIVEDGKTVYARGRGLADVAAGTPITPDTVFRLGSITKQFSASVMMQLVQEGKVSLDDPLSKYLPDYPGPGADATIRQLLNHTVGVQSYTAIPGWMVEENTARPYTTGQMIALFRDMPVVSPPGQAWAYNNSGYVLVGAVIEAVTGKPWHQAVEERIARPLGLGTIRYGVGEETMPNMAKGYTGGQDGQQPARRIHMSVPHAAGALVGDVRDLARWGQALHHGKVVGAQAYAQMIAPTMMPDGKPVPYGFGLGQDKVRGREAIGHGGGIFGFSTDSTYIPAEGIFVAVLTNSDDPATSPGIATARLAALALGDPYAELKPALVAPATIEPLLGAYKVEGEGPDRIFFVRDGQLYTRRGEAPEQKAVAAGGDRFFYGPNSLTWFSVRRDAGGAHVMEMHQGGEDQAETSVRTGPVPPEPEAFSVPRATLENYVGTYVLGPMNVIIAFQEGKDALGIELGRQGVKRLRATGPTEFQVEGVPARIVFDAAAGPAPRLTVHQGPRQMVATRVP
jgi:CubicO group peptidase (beta-lactamase class C family)